MRPRPSDTMRIPRFRVQPGRSQALWRSIGGKHLMSFNHSLSLVRS